MSNRGDRPAEQDRRTTQNGTAGERGARTAVGRAVRRPRTWVVAGAVAAVGGGYVAAALALGGTVPRGTTVLGADLGGLDRAAAADALAGPAGEVRGRPLPLRVTGAGAALDTGLDPAAAGLAVDVDATAGTLTAPAWDPRDLWRHLAGGGEQRPVVDVDRDALTDALRAVAEDVDAPAAEGAVVFAVTPAEGDAPARVEPVVEAPAEGRSLDVAAAADTVAAAWPADGPVELTADVERPSADAAAIEAAAEEIARPAVAGDLVVAGGGRDVVLAPAVFAPALAVRPVDGTPELVADGEALQAAVLAADPGFEVPAQDARIEVDGEVPRVVPSVEGSDLAPEDLAGAVTAALTVPTATATGTATPTATGTATADPGPAPEPSRRAEVDLRPAVPALTTEQLQQLNVVERISTFSTTLTSNRDRTENIRIAAAAIDGTLLRPGEEFSMNDVVGERTPERGYNRAGVISGGRLVEDYGGGISQLSTTLFNAVFFAGLDEIEHRPHSFYISRYPAGREATIDWRSIDNRFRNDSGNGVYVQAYVADGEVTVSMYGTRFRQVRAESSGRYAATQPRTIYDTSSDCSPQSANPGFTIDVTRVMTPVGGGPEERETWTTRYNPQNRIVCGPDPATVRPSPTATPSPTGTPAPPEAPPAPEGEPAPVPEG
ncbi:VanW family protein [Kineococcus sp. SYSU DK004]|uniref:VanW family protein n=1 Tax=Kineococcus sp. SYSU DK004 TaxID=3383125 RepID=UPI003D7E5454